MADKAISELVSAQQITATDMFVLEQNGTAKKLTGQVLLNWLTAAANGHGGIQSISKISTSGLADTYRITLADQTTFDFVVTNGRSVNSITKTSTSGLVDTYRISYNDGTSGTFTVTNGAKGDKGDTAYIWIKYASQQPTASSSSFGDIPDDWMGVYFGFSATAPTDWQQYKWYKVKGEKGDTGTAATLISGEVTYQTSTSGTIIPSGQWQSNIPVVSQGNYLWTRTVYTFNTGSPVTTYSVSRFGMDGSGAVSSVAGISPDAEGNVQLTASNVGAVNKKGDTMEGPLDMNGQTLSGLNAPVSDTEPVTLGYATETYLSKEDAETDYASKDYVKTKTISATLLSSGWSETLPYSQTITIDVLTDEVNARAYPEAPTGTLEEKLALAEEIAKVRWCTRAGAEMTFECPEEKPNQDIPVIVEVYV